MMKVDLNDKDTSDTIAVVEDSAIAGSEEEEEDEQEQV